MTNINNEVNMPMLIVSNLENYTDRVGRPVEGVRSAEIQGNQFVVEFENGITHTWTLDVTQA